MDVQVLGAWGEFLGGVAGVVASVGVIGSLIFVGIQLREQNREAQLVAAQEVSKGYRNVTETLLEDSTLTGGFLSVVKQGFGELDEVEAMRVQLYFQSVLRFWEDAFFRYEAGRLDRRHLESVERGLAAIISSPGFTQYWASRSTWYTDSFISYIESQRRDTPFRTVKEGVKE
jgi:hypothetical protein